MGLQGYEQLSIHTRAPPAVHGNAVWQAILRISIPTMTDSPIIISVHDLYGSDLSSFRPSAQERQSVSLFQTFLMALIEQHVQTGHRHDRVGRNGTDAAPPVRGGPGGLLVIELSESGQTVGYKIAAE